MSTDTSPTEIRGKLQTWLMEDGWSIRQQSLPDTVWAFVAEDEQKRKLIVGQRSAREDEILLQGAIVIDEETGNKIAGLDEDERNNFLWDLRFELLRTNLEFQGVEIPLKQINVTERIFMDALTKDAFLQRASEVRKGVLVVLWMVNREFAQQPPHRQLGFQR